MIKGINHITFAVADLEASIVFYRQALGADLRFQSERTAYFDLAGLWLALNVQDLPRQGNTSYTHVAFTVEEAEMDEMKTYLQALGVAIKLGRSREAGEGRSLYFHDPDGHLLEVHSGSLETRLAAYSRPKTANRNS